MENTQKTETSPVKSESPSFSKSSLLQNIQFVLNTALQQRKNIEDIIDILEEQQQIEEKYGKAMEKLSNNIVKIIDKQKIGKEHLQLIRGFISSNAQQSLTLSNSLKDDLIKNLRDSIKVQQQAFKNLQDDGKKLEKDMIKISEQLKSSLMEFKLKKREYEQQATILVVYNLLSEYGEEKRIKQLYKVNSLKKETEETEKKYATMITENNNTYELYHSKITLILNKLQEQEEERLNILSDGLMKQIIFAVSKCKNIQYDLEKITDRVHQLSTPGELQKYIDDNQFELSLQRQKQQNFNSFISQSLQLFFQIEYDEQLDTVANNEILKLIQLCYTDQQNEQLLLDQKIQVSYKNTNEIAVKIRITATFFQKVWEATYTEEELSKFLQQFKYDRFIRKAFVLCFLEKREKKQFVITPQQFDSLVSVMKEIIKICGDEYDTVSSKKLMQASFQFYKKLDEKTFFYLYMELNKMSLWQNRDYWETVIISQIYEQLKFTTYKTDSTMDNISKEKNIILTILTQFSQNMLLYNFNVDHIKDIMWKFCSFFSLNQEISSDLLIGIDGFYQVKSIMNQQQIQQTQQQVAPIQQQQQPPAQQQETNEQQKTQQQENSIMDRMSQFFQ